MLSYREYLNKVMGIVGDTCMEEGIEIRTYNHDNKSIEYVVVDPITQQEITLESATSINDVREFIRKNYLNQ